MMPEQMGLMNHDATMEEMPGAEHDSEVTSAVHQQMPVSSAPHLLVQPRHTLGALLSNQDRSDQPMDVTRSRWDHRTTGWVPS